MLLPTKNTDKLHLAQFLAYFSNTKSQDREPNKLLFCPQMNGLFCWYFVRVFYDYPTHYRTLMFDHSPSH